MRSSPMPVNEAAAGGFYWLASYPKSGNTWLRCFITAILGGDGGDLNLNLLATDAIASARFWLDDVLGFDSAELNPDELDRLRPLVYQWADEPAKIYYHKTHDAYLRAADGAPLMHGSRVLGTVYLVRNPLDVAHSYAHHNGSDIDRAIAFMADPRHSLADHRHRATEQARQFMGTWSGHVRSWTDARDHQVLVLRYEDLLVEAVGSFERAASFLRLPCGAVDVATAVRRASFSALRKLESESGFDERPANAAVFFRDGKSGTWRERLSAAQVARVIADHGDVMHRFGYLDAGGRPL